MKKHIGGYKLNMDSSARLALMKNLVYALIQNEAILTTKTKAKAVTPIFEKLITRAKLDSVQNRRLVQAYVQDRSIVKKLFQDIAPRYKTVMGGYTKLTLIGNRRGDNASMAKLSLIKQSAPILKAAAPAKDKVKDISSTSSKSKASKVIVPEVLKPTAAAPKLLKRTLKRGDK